MSVTRLEKAEADHAFIGTWHIYEQKDIFQKRCYKIVSDTSDMGWGFHDTLSEIYEDAFQ